MTAFTGLVAEWRYTTAWERSLRGGAGLAWGIHYRPRVGLITYAWPNSYKRLV